MSQQAQYLIILGAPKCGSTSLFEYLREHPQVCACVHKEPDFFRADEQQNPLTARYMLKAAKEQNFAAYEALFPCKDKPVRLEASVGYFQSSVAPARIKRWLPDAKLVLVFRNPVDRFISAYFGMRQRGWIAPDVTLEAYLQRQARTWDEPKMRALLAGLYTDQLKRYYEHFPREQILLFGFREVRDTPVAVMERICQAVGIDGAFFRTFNFGVSNPTTDVRSWPLNQLVREATRTAHRNLLGWPRTYQALSRLGEEVLFPAYQRLNSAPLTQREQVPSVVRQELEAFYAHEAQSLADLTGMTHLLDR